MSAWADHPGPAVQTPPIPTDEPPDGTIIRFVKQGFAKAYVYAALRVDNRWYLTGNPNPFSWLRLKDHMQRKESTPVVWDVIYSLPNQND